MTHVFISYDDEYQDFAVVLRDALQSYRFQTWLDVDDMVGSAFETKAEAIENAAVVIMCMSESYKESKTCKKDIVHAEKWDKPIIPICVESGGFIPSGWLEYAAEDNTVINFSEPEDFDENFGQLLKELAAKGVAPDEVDEDDEGDDEDEEDDEGDDKDEDDDEDDDDDEEYDGALVAADDCEVVEVVRMERLIIRTAKK